MKLPRLPLVFIHGIFLWSVNSFASELGEINVQLQDDPVTLNPYNPSDSVSTQILQNIYEPLLKYEIVNKEVVLKPSILQNIKSSLNYTLWNFTIDLSKKWSDGSSLTNSQVYDGLMELISPGSRYEGVADVLKIVGAEDYFKGKNKDKSKVGIKLIGKDKLEIKLKSGNAFFSHLLTSHSFTPLHPKLKTFFKTLKPKDFITLAPYVLNEIIVGGKIVTKKNYYYDSSDIYSGINFLVIKNHNTALNLFQEGRLDFVVSVPNEQVQFAENNLSGFKTYPIKLYHYLGFNTQSEKFKSPEIRRRIRDIVFSLENWPINKPLTMKRYLFNEKNKIIFPRAKPFEAPFKFKVLVYKEAINKDNLYYLQAELKKFNFEMEIELLDWKSLLAQVNNNLAEAFYLGMGAWFENDADVLMDILYNPNFSWKNEDLKTKFQAWLQSPKDSLREMIVKGIYDEAPFVPMVQVTRKVIISEKIKNYKEWPILRFRF